MKIKRDEIQNHLRAIEREVQRIIGAEYEVKAYGRDTVQICLGGDLRVATTIHTTRPLDSDEPKRMRYNFSAAGDCDPTDPADIATRVYTMTATLMAHAAELKPILEELANATIED